MSRWLLEPWGEPAEQPSYKAYGQQPGPSAGVSTEERKLFPLPYFACPERKAGSSRRVQQRRARIRKMVENANEALEALNWLAGYGTTSGFTMSPSPMQWQTMMRVDGLACGQKPSGVIDGFEAALRSLLKGGTPYDMEASNVSLASYQPGLLSIPDDVHDCPDLSSVLSMEDRQYLEDDKLMLKSVEDLEQGSIINPYWDPKLRADKKAYRGLVQRLHQIGYFTYTTAPKCQVGVFFVWKSSRTKLRMITDARVANRHFVDPPGVSLLSGEGFGRIEVKLEDATWFDEMIGDRLSIHVGLSDVKDCFHRMRVPAWLARYFAWEPVEARVVGLSGMEIDGKKLMPHDLVWPCAGSLCQGFSWSLFFAQRANEFLCSKVSPLADAKLARDRGAPVVLRVGKGIVTSPHYYVYVDNLGVLDTDAENVNSAMVALQSMFNSLGLELHGSEVSSGQVEALGCVLEGSSMRSLPSPKRIWRIHHAIQGLLRRGRCMGRVLEVIVGHCTFLGLLNRMSLSVFKTVYPFIQKHYYDVTRLWPSVIEELKAFRGLVFLLVQDWWRPWNPVVTSSDASLTGFGVCQSHWPQDVVATTGRRLERSRFRRVGGHSARESALTAAGFYYDGRAWGPVGTKTAKQLSEAGWAVDDTFVEVPVGSLKRKLWSPKIWGRWKFKENIGILEARTVLKSIQRICMTRFGHDVRHLHLCDNLGVVLSIERCRSKNFKLLSVIRRIAGYCIARNVQLAIRWVPSELNIADEPSRLDDPEVSKLLVDLIFADDFQPFSPKLPPTCTHASKADTNTGTCRAPEQLGKQADTSSRSQEAALIEHREQGPSSKDGAQAHSEFARGCASGETFARERGERSSSAGQRHGAQSASGSEAPADREGGHGDERQWKHFIRMAGRERRRQKAFLEKQGKKESTEARQPGHGRGLQWSKCFGDGGCDTKGETELRPEVVRAPRPCCQGEVQLHGQRGCRQDAGQTLQREVPRRRRQSLWGLCDGHSDGQTAGLWSVGPLEGPKVLEVPQGMAQAVPISLEACLPTSSVVCNELANGGAWAFPEGSVQPASGINIPSTWSTTTSSAPWFGPADCGGDKLLVDANQPDRDLGHLKDWHKGRQHHVGLKVVGLPGSNSVAIEQRKEDRESLEVRLQRVPQRFPDVCRGASDSVGSLPSPPLRAKHRQGFQGKRLGRSDEARPMADQEERTKVREGSETGGNVAEVEQQRSADMQVGRTSHRGHYARPRLSSHPSAMLKSSQYFADFFSGHGGVARSARALGFRSREWELLHGPSGDLTKPAVLSNIRTDISNRKIVAAMLAPPCSSFSPARDRTSVIRDKNHPWGLPNISIRDQEKVRLGNQCLRSSLRIIKWLDDMGVPWVLENPHSSKMWYVPELIKLQQADHTHVIVTDFCQFGTCWRKRTRLLCGNLQWDDVARCQRTCLGHGICSRTNKQHFQLTGSNKHGVPWTRVAQPYPHQLCHALAFTLTAPARIVPYN